MTVLTNLIHHALLAIFVCTMFSGGITCIQIDSIDKTRSSIVDDTQAIDLSSAEQVTTAHFTYLGCYKDSRDRGRDVVGGYYGYGHTAETCSLKAKEMKHKYFAV